MSHGEGFLPLQLNITQIRRFAHFGRTVHDRGGIERGEGVEEDGVRCYAVSDMTYHPNLATVQYNVFFNLCRLKGVHFDLQDKLGTAFMLVDSFAAGVIGVCMYVCVCVCVLCGVFV